MESVWMDVVAISAEKGWRWRIVGHAGEVVEQSREIFATIAAALVSGAWRRQAIDVAPPTVARGWKRWMPRRERLSA